MSDIKQLDAQIERLMEIKPREGKVFLAFPENLKAAKLVCQIFLTAVCLRPAHQPEEGK